MSSYTPQQLREVLALHKKWLRTYAKSGERASLGGVGLSGLDLRDADLRSANLSYADLRGADLSDAILRGADLRYADLRGAKLRSANVRDADLGSANLTGADLADANLTSANLIRTDLSSTNLSAAYLSGADLRGAEGILRGPCIDEYESFLVRFEDGPRIKVGCRWFTIAKAKEHWGDVDRHCSITEKSGDLQQIRLHCRLVLTAVAGLLAVADELGWPGCGMNATSTHNPSSGPASVDPSRHAPHTAPHAG